MSERDTSAAVTLDPWAKFRAATRARVGLGRSGDGLPTTALLDFQLAHAQARDAVHSAVDFAALERRLAPLPCLRLHSAAADRAIYLRRPDLGRSLDEASRAKLTVGDWDLVFVIADGLSAAAVEHQAEPMLLASLARLSGLKIGPVVLAEQARVALGDEIGAGLGARMVAVLIGERPGLSVADSLGLYLTHGPRTGRRDSERNCISNIHGDGLAPAAAADKLAWLATEALRRGLTGISLKENAPALEGSESPALSTPS